MENIDLIGFSFKEDTEGKGFDAIQTLEEAKGKVKRALRSSFKTNLDEEKSSQNFLVYDIDDSLEFALPQGQMFFDINISKKLFDSPETPGNPDKYFMVSVETECLDETYMSVSQRWKNLFITILMEDFAKHGVVGLGRGKHYWDLNVQEYIEFFSDLNRYIDIVSERPNFKEFKELVLY